MNFWCLVSYYYDCIKDSDTPLSDLYLHTLVKSPVKIELGGKATLMVNKSEAGDVFWAHNGEIIPSDDSHYTMMTFFNTYTWGLTEAGLEISNATSEQAGFYEAILFKGNCHVRNIIEVQVEGEQ